MTCGYTSNSEAALRSLNGLVAKCSERGELSLSESDSGSTYRRVRYASPRTKSTRFNVLCKPKVEMSPKCAK